MSNLMLIFQKSTFIKINVYQPILIIKHVIAKEMKTKEKIHQIV